MMDVSGLLGVARIEGVQALSHLSGVVALEDINGDAQRFGISNLLWLAAIIASSSQKNVGLSEVSSNSQILSSFPGNLFQSSPIGAEKVES